MQMGGVNQQRPYLCKSIVIQMGVASRYFPKVLQPGVDVMSCYMQISTDMPPIQRNLQMFRVEKAGKPKRGVCIKQCQVVVLIVNDWGF